ncbi:MAG: hypothetical protein HFE04_03415 [Bacilli bacterium]|nr:hypothetical protein [Bacilli bacterium]
MEKFKINNSKDNKSELKTFRIKTELLTKIEELSNKYNISINKLVNQCIEYSLNNLEEDSINPNN